jgi:hypothetical protein
MRKHGHYPSLHDIWKKISTLAGKATEISVSYVEKALLNGNLRNAPCIYQH